VDGAAVESLQRLPAFSKSWKAVGRVQSGQCVLRKRMHRPKPGWAAALRGERPTHIEHRHGIRTRRSPAGRTQTGDAV